MPLRHFLLIYNVREGRLVGWYDLGEDGERAAQRYSDAEAEYRERQGFEIVLVGADSLDTIRKTHAHYFDGGDAADAFAELIAP